MDFYPFDAEYVRRLREGDAEVEEHFTLYFEERLRIKLRSDRYQPADIDDIIQDTFLRALVKIAKDGLRQAESLGAFVFGICKHVCHEKVRGTKKLEPLTEDVSRYLQNGDNPERDVLESERMRALQRAIRATPEKRRRLLKAYFFEGRPKAEICVTFGVSPDYLRVCLHRVKKELKRRFLKEFDKKQKPNDEEKDH